MWFRKRRDEDFAAEIEAHVRLEADQLMAQGIPAHEAESAARRAFGNTTRAQERFYESARWLWLDELRQDIRFGIRVLWKARSFVVAAALTIALGVGANTAVFSLMDAVLLRSLPVEKPKELIFLGMAGTAGPSGPPPYPCFVRLREEAKSLTGLAAFAIDEFRLEIGGVPEQVMGQAASGNYFELLGVKPLLGRVLTPQDEHLDPPVAVISERYWRKRFGAHPAVLGRSISNGQRSFVIVGVTPGEFFGLLPGRPVDITVPIGTQDRLASDPTAVWLHGIIGRLKPGATAAQARAEADVVFRSFMTTSRYPADLIARHFHHMEAAEAGRGMDELRRRFSQPLAVLVGIAGLVLLLAVANIANLLLSRGISRSREFAIRLATGAGRGRIVRQLLTETTLLFCLGAIPGVLLANWGVGWIDSMFREGRRAVEVEAGLNLRVLIFSLCLTLAAGLISGLLPAWRAFRSDPQEAIKEGHERTGESRGVSWLSQGLVAFQVGLSLVLLVGALLFTSTLASLRNLNAGFRAEHVLTMSLQSQEGTADIAKSIALWSRALETVRRIPTVRSAAISTFTPLSGRDRGALVRIRSYQPQSTEDATIHTNQVSEGYFESLGISLVRGRLLTERDAEGAAKVVLINESAARKFFGDRDPIGELVMFTRKGGDVSYQIAGVVRDTKHMNLREQAPRFAYIPMRQSRDVDGRITLMLTSGNPGREMDLLPPVRKALSGIAPDILISDVITIQKQLDATLLTERLLSGLSATFGILAMFLAAVGLYGLLSYRVGRQRHSIGIRMALGASPSAVTMGVLRHSGLVIAIGIVAALPFAFMAARTAGSMLWGVKAEQLSIYAICISLLLIVGMLSAYLPARRAAKVEPVEALRHS
jgi:predicted permease